MDSHIHACYDYHYLDNLKWNSFSFCHFSWSNLWPSTVTLNLNMHDCFYGLKRLAGLGVCEAEMSVWCWRDFFPLIFFLYLPYTTTYPVLEYRDKLFTHSNQKPASKERIHNQGIVKLSATPPLLFLLTPPPSLIIFPLFNLHSGLTRSRTLHHAENPSQRACEA